MINICVPVLRRYDLLRGMLQSLRRSQAQPDAVYVVDNGRDPSRLLAALQGVVWPVHTYRPDAPMGVAESWNWFIMNVEEDRIITNDDVVFAPQSLGAIVASTANLVWASGFSCFMIRDACVEKVGLFDETISPGYGYYEDEDYLQRLDGRGTRPRAASAENVDCEVKHLHSQTLMACSSAEVQEHHRKFKVAQENYARKWGVTF